MSFNYTILKTMRKKHKYTLSAVAKALNIRPGSYRKKELGEIITKISDIDKLAKFYNVPVRSFFGPGPESEKIPDAVQLQSILLNIDGNIKELSSNIDAMKEFSELQTKLSIVQAELEKYKLTIIDLAILITKKDQELNELKAKLK